MKFLVMGIALAIGSANVAVGQTIKEKELVKKPLEADRGYIFLRSPEKFAGTFLRIPTEQDVSAYREEREAAFAEELDKYEELLVDWEKKVEWAKDNRQRIPAKPEKPTYDNFSFEPFEIRHSVEFDAHSYFSKNKEDGSFSYLIAVDPGTYVWYGPVFAVNGLGMVGVCFCMGSVSFDVAAGKVTDLGDYLTTAPKFEQQHTAPLLPIQVPGAFSALDIDLPKRSQQPTFGLPKSLSALSGARAEFRAAGKINNFYGVMISRLPPIDGILGYERDKVIDLRTGETLAEGPPGSAQAGGGAS